MVAYQNNKVIKVVNAPKANKYQRLFSIEHGYRAKVILIHPFYLYQINFYATGYHQK